MSGPPTPADAGHIAYTGPVTMTRLDGLQVCPRGCGTTLYDGGHSQHRCRCGAVMVEPNESAPIASSIAPPTPPSVTPPAVSRHERDQPLIQVQQRVDITTEAQRLRDEGKSLRDIAPLVGKSIRWLSVNTTSHSDQEVLHDQPDYLLHHVLHRSDQDNDRRTGRERMALSAVRSSRWSDWWPSPPYLAHTGDCVRYNGLIDNETGKVGPRRFYSGDWNCPACHHHKSRITSYSVMLAYRDGLVAEHLSLMIYKQRNLVTNAKRRAQRNGYQWLTLTQTDNLYGRRFVLLSEENIHKSHVPIDQAIHDLMTEMLYTRIWYTVRRDYRRVSPLRPKKSEPHATSFGVSADKELLNQAIIEAGYEPGESVGNAPAEIKQAHGKIKLVYKRMMDERKRKGVTNDA